ncbi:MAG: ABC transporter ATP-binding protein [Methanoregula sp.]
MYPIINYGLGVQSQPKLLDIFYENILPSSLNPFIASAIILILVTILIAVFYGIVSYHGAYIIASIRDSLDRRVFEKVMSNEYSYFAMKKQGDIIYIGQGAVNEASNAISSCIDFFKNSLTAFFYLIFIFYLSFWLTGGLIIVGVFYALLVKKYLFTRVYRNSFELTNAAMERSVVYQELLSGIKTIFITDSLDFFKGKYESAINRLLKTYTNVNALNKVPSIINDFLMFSIISIGAILMYLFTGGNFILYIGIFGTLMLALYRLIPCVSSAQSNLAVVVQSLPALTLVYSELISEAGERACNNKEKKPTFSFEDKIEFKNVFFGYHGSNQDVVHDLSLTIRKNSKVAIVGNSGSGKTTTANLLALLYSPRTGGIFIDGTDIKTFDHSDYLQSLGYIGQETFIFHDTIKENIRFGLTRTDQEIIEAAKLADAHDFIMNTDHGYDSIVGDQGVKLSGGQRQRIAIARIILRNPEILLLDEATSSLDNISEKKITNSITKLSEKMTVITIAHRLSTIRGSDVIHVMRDGNIVERGSHTELMDIKGDYYQLYMRQVAGETKESK